MSLIMEQISIAKHFSNFPTDKITMQGSQIMVFYKSSSRSVRLSIGTLMEQIKLIVVEKKLFTYR